MEHPNVETETNAQFSMNVDLLLMAAHFLERYNQKATIGQVPSNETQTYSGSSAPSVPTKATTKCYGSSDLCVVCGDRSTGVHYQAMACEGCKGFFRRSVRKNLTYRCYKNKSCIVNKTTRNRCQSCRLDKCFRLGMNPSAVRPDRIKKIQEIPIETNEERVSALTNDIVRSHGKYFIGSPSIQECTMEERPMAEAELCSQHSDFSSQGTRRIVGFANDIPAFMRLNDSDRKLLIDYGLTEIMVFRASTRYVPEKDCLVLPNRARIGMSEVERHMGSLTDTVRRLARTLTELDLNSIELALFEAMILFSPDRLGCQENGRVHDLFDDVRGMLRTTMRERRQGRGSTAFTRLFKAYCDIRCDAFVHWQMENESTSTTGPADHVFNSTVSP